MLVTKWSVWTLEAVLSPGAGDISSERWTAQRIRASSNEYPLDIVQSKISGVSSRRIAQRSALHCVGRNEEIRAPIANGRTLALNELAVLTVLSSETSMHTLQSKDDESLDENSNNLKRALPTEWTMR